MADEDKKEEAATKEEEEEIEEEEEEEAPKPKVRTIIKRIVRRVPAGDSDLIGEIAEHRKRIKRLEGGGSKEEDKKGDGVVAWIPSIIAGIAVLAVFVGFVYKRFRNQEEEEYE